MRTTYCLCLLSLLGCARSEPDAPVETAAASEGFLSKGDLVFFGEPESSKALTWTGPRTFQLTGDARGYAHTRDRYQDFKLHLEFRWLEAEAISVEKRSEANTGVLLFIGGEHAIWPRCLEVQGKWTELGRIKSNARDISVSASEKSAVREDARKPPGQWNQLEITARGGAVTSRLNGDLIAESEPTELRDGPIGFQLEGFDVEFRNVEIRSIP